MDVERVARRGRPPLVSVEGIVEAALRQAPGSWSISEIAGALGVSPQAVYRHVATVGELLETVIEHVVRTGLIAPIRQPTQTPQQYLTEVAWSVRRLLEGNPGVALAVVSQGWLGATPALDQFLERCIENLAEAGIDPGEANIALDLVLHWTVGWVGRHEAADTPGTPGSTVDTDPPPAGGLSTPLLDRARREAPDADGWFARQLMALTSGSVGRGPRSARLGLDDRQP